MQQIVFEEIFEYPIDEFKTHLEDDGNERIVFSGKYGIGKTSFLNNFFNERNQKKLEINYEIYRIFPINYSIASNEDILRYIKYDIIIEMLRKDISFQEAALEIIDTMPVYVQNNFTKVLSTLIYMIPKLGKEVVEVYEKIETLQKDFLKFHKESNISSGDKLIEYQTALELKEGSIFENDIITKIISETISSRDSKSVLLIDDFDRLDPEHVFRILNVFASHFDANSTSGNRNKFNFNKIVIVSDFNNIRHLFHHKYGLDTDFMGYIDKFYSSEIYHFDNRAAIAKIINKVLYSVKFTNRGVDETKDLQEIYFQNGFIIEMITLLLDRGFINLRNIIRLYEKNVGYHYNEITLEKNSYKIHVLKVPIIVHLRLLKDFFGDLKNMKLIIEKLYQLNYGIPQFQYYFAESLYFLNYKAHNFHPRDEFLKPLLVFPVSRLPKLKDAADVVCSCGWFCSPASPTSV